jgi:hypothetical protein
LDVSNVTSSQVFSSDKKKAKKKPKGGEESGDGEAPVEPPSRIKKELLKEMKNLAPGDRVVVIGCTSRPQAGIEDYYFFISFFFFVVKLDGKSDPNSIEREAFRDNLIDHCMKGQSFWRWAFILSRDVSLLGTNKAEDSHSLGSSKSPCCKKEQLLKSCRETGARGSRSGLQVHIAGAKEDSTRLPTSVSLVLSLEVRCSK